MNKTRGTPALSAAALSLLLLLVVGGLGQAVSAQHLISSKAGFVNRAEGKVYIQRQDSAEDEEGRASLGTQMRNGDQLRTAADSHAEVLLNPGSYLRMNEKTEVRALNTSLAEARFELLKGSVIIEVSELDKKTPLEIVTPQGPVAIAKLGLYRIDAEGSATAIRVEKGELTLGTRDQLLAGGGTKVGSGKIASLDGDSTKRPDIAKAGNFFPDEFDNWSFQRAEMLVAANHSVLSQNRTLSLLSFGWMFDPFYNCYTYIPGSRRFNSAYGFGFFNGFSYCSCSMPYYYPYYGSGPYSGGGGTVSNSLRPSTTPRVAPGTVADGRTPIHREIPPSRQIDPGARVTHNSDFGGGRSVDMGSSRGSMGGGTSSNGMSSNSNSGRSVDMGGGGSRGSVGSAPPPSAPSHSAPPPPPPPPPSSSSSSSSAAPTRIIH